MRECLEESHLSETWKTAQRHRRDSGVLLSLPDTNQPRHSMLKPHKKETFAKMSAVIMHMYDSFVTNGLSQALWGLISFGVSFLLNRCEQSKSAVNCVASGTLVVLLFYLVFLGDKINFSRWKIQEELYVLCVFIVKDYSKAHRLRSNGTMYNY